MSSLPTVSVRVFALIVEAGRGRGVDMDRVLTEVGIDPSVLADPEARLPLDREDALWDATARACDDPVFGLSASQHARADAFDVLGYAMRTSATVGDALHAAVRYNRLIHDIAVFSVSLDRGVARLDHAFRGDPRGPCPHAADYTLAAVYQAAKALTGTAFGLREVWLSHAAPADTAPYRRVFGITPAFSRPHGRIAFDESILGRPIVTRDETLHGILRRHADEALDRLPEDHTVVTRVRQAVAPKLCAGEPSIDTVASGLAMSPRTLQRRLAEEGTTWRGVVDRLKHDLALRWLGAQDLSVAEVGYLLGYSEPSPFHRAFRRWTGQTPAQWRGRNLARTDTAR